jgi:hypothetical protein
LWQAGRVRFRPSRNQLLQQKGFLVFDPTLYQLCFGLRFGERESVAQAERRRNATGAKRPSANRRRKHANLAMPYDAARDERAFLRNGTGVVVRETGPTISLTSPEICEKANKIDIFSDPSDYISCNVLFLN